MFIEEQQCIDLEVYYKKHGYIYECRTKGEFNQGDISEVDKSKYSKLTVKMKILDWAAYNTLQESSMVDDPLTQDRKFNYKVYKETRLKYLLQGWDAKDKDGNPIPINPASLGKLAPAIGEAILRAYDEESFLDKDEEKNS